MHTTHLKTTLEWAPIFSVLVSDLLVQTDAGCSWHCPQKLPCHAMAHGFHTSPQFGCKVVKLQAIQV